MSVTGWAAVLLAAAVCYLAKLAGYVVPREWLARPRVLRVSGSVTVALLSALLAVQTFTDGRTLVLDARAAGLGVAAVALWLRAPFLLVVVLAAATAAALRALA